MSGNANLQGAKKAKQDEFYTQYNDIQQEVNAYLEYNPDTFRNKTVLLPCDDPDWSRFTRFFMDNFNYFGLRKLISTSYAHASKNVSSNWDPTEFEKNSPNFNPQKSRTQGKVFTLDRETRGCQRIDINNLEWHYLEGTGDFRSEEVVTLRDEADIIVTNPPFSLFREFVSWIFEGQKKFLIIGNQNAITYKEIFPLIRENKIWLGVKSGGMSFTVPDDYEERATGFWIDDKGQKWRSMGNICWFTNLEHGHRHEPLQLMTMEDNIKYSRHKEVRGNTYKRYDNYDAIEVPYVDSIPDNYDEIMGVPITFLDKYCPEQFEIVGATESEGKGFSNGLWNSQSGVAQPVVNGERLYKRLFIRKKQYL